MKKIKCASCGEDVADVVNTTQHKNDGAAKMLCHGCSKRHEIIIVARSSTIDYDCGDCCHWDGGYYCGGFVGAWYRPVRG